MDPRTQERVERWDSRPFADGYDGLSNLADSGFSGAVTTAGTWLFMLNGRVVGVVDGTMDAFENATGTTYVAPDPALPLLSSMTETGGETRAKYYTNDTPLEDVDTTLSEKSFTGYIELSEGVLSGDYYVVYYGGRRMAAAYIGNAERLLTDDEAFARAADEVGIYEVVDVTVEVTDVPGAAGATPASVEADTAPESESETDAGAEAGLETTSFDETDLESSASPDGSAGVGDAATASGHDDPAIDTPLGIDDEDDHDDSWAEPDGIDAVSASPLGGDDGTGDEGDEPEPDPSALITDVDGDEATDSTSTPGDDPESEPTGITTDDEPSANPTTTGITDETAGSIVDEAESGSNAAGNSSSDPAEDRPSRSSESEQPASPPDHSRSTSRATTPSPDPADLEAAAEELGESGLPWADADDPVDDTPTPDSDPDPTPDLDPDPDTVLTPETEDGTDPSPLDERFEQEARWRETRRIPSIDPDNTSESAPSSEHTDPSRTSRRSQPQNTDEPARSRHQRGPRSPASSADTVANTGADTVTRTDTDTSGEPRAGSESAPAPESGSDTGSRPGPTTSTESGSGPAPGPEDALESDMLEREDKIDQLTQRVDDLEGRRETLRAEKEDVESERARLESTNEELTTRVEQLQSRIEELESELERLRSVDATGATATAGSGGGRQLTPQQALSGTNLFVRYGSKSQPTLETAHAGEADATAVGSNLRLEHHTQFVEDDVTVDGRPFEEFLADSMEYQFVDWLTGTLLYEIRDTGHAGQLGDLYDVIPRIDRAELQAGISLAEDDTENVPDQVTFDVVAFDKRGTPLVAVNLNDSRDPATREMLVNLEEASSAVNANYPDLGAAMVVTSSFFDPGALEVAEEATGGGFLSRGSKLSYVNLSRKQGYHLCLVESRGGGFHLNVPEL